MFSRYSLMHVWEWDERISVNPARRDNNNLMHRGSGLRTFFPLMLLMPLIALSCWCCCDAKLFWLHCSGCGVNPSREMCEGVDAYIISFPIRPSPRRLDSSACEEIAAWLPLPENNSVSPRCSAAHKCRLRFSQTRTIRRTMRALSKVNSIVIKN
jgi:hypothetical protein